MVLRMGDTFVLLLWSKKGESMFQKRMLWMMIVVCSMSVCDWQCEGLSVSTIRSRKLSSRVPRLSSMKHDTEGTITRPSRHMKYVRVQPRTTRGNRRVFELQTAVTSFYRQNNPNNNSNNSNNNNNSVQVDLHAQLHLADESYYQYYNDHNTFTSNYQNVFYELVVSEDLLSTDTQTGNRKLTPTSTGLSPIMASPSDTQTARQYGLSCQADLLNYAQPSWIHADYTRQQFVQNKQNKQKQTSFQNRINKQEQDLPLWALASSTPLFPGVEFISALFRPSTPSTPITARVTRRLFSNLFLPGDALAAFFRAILWTGIPAPELSVLLLDWSSLTPRPTGGISPIATPVFESILTGNLMEARKLVFSQMIISGQAAENGGSNNFIIGQRNQHALKILNDNIQTHYASTNNNNTNDKPTKYALVYGGMHCKDLHTRLEAMGFVATKTEWRTAWSINVPTFGSGQTLGTPFAQTSTPTGIAAGLVLLPLYLAVGAFDWLATVQGITESIQNTQIIDALTIYIFYLLRHVALYLGLGKFLVEWDGTNLFTGTYK